MPYQFRMLMFQREVPHCADTERTLPTLRLGLHGAIFSPQVFADDSTEEADHIETNGAAFVRSTVIFSPYIFAENGQLVHVKSRWCA